MTLAYRLGQWNLLLKFPTTNEISQNGAYLAGIYASQLAYG